MQKTAKNLPQILQIHDYWLITPSVQKTMLLVCLCLFPGIFTSIFIFGPGILVNLIMAILFGLVLELILNRLKGSSMQDFAFDGSGAVMAIIFALSLPPSLPWWILLIGISFSIAIGKYAYGGTGNNVFNPAMVGVAALLISFPAEMNHWRLIIDTQGGATPLDSLQTSLRLSQTITEVQSSNIFGQFGSNGHEWINLAFLIGGLVLIQQKIIRWHIPAGVLFGLFLITIIFQINDSDHYPNIMFHLFGGATMLCAFFVATDPVTSPITAKGRFIYGFLIGITIYVLRTWGSYPEGIAFAILLMNATAPIFDHYFRPKPLT